MVVRGRARPSRPCRSLLMPEYPNDAGSCCVARGGKLCRRPGKVPERRPLVRLCRWWTPNCPAELILYAFLDRPFKHGSDDLHRWCDLRRGRAQGVCHFSRIVRSQRWSPFRNWPGTARQIGHLSRGPGSVRVLDPMDSPPAASLHTSRAAVRHAAASTSGGAGRRGQLTASSAEYPSSPVRAKPNTSSYLTMQQSGRKGRKQYSCLTDALRVRHCREAPI